MKQIIYLLAFAFMSVNTSAQLNISKNSPTSIEGLIATLDENNLHIDWKSNKMDDANYWEVQASTDGKSFTTIGLVMGTDPKAARGYYSFKQIKNKIKPGIKFFRVLHIENDDNAMASNTIGLSKL